MLHAETVWLHLSNRLGQIKVVMHCRLGECPVSANCEGPSGAGGAHRRRGGEDLGPDASAGTEQHAAGCGGGGGWPLFWA